MAKNILFVISAGHNHVALSELDLDLDPNGLQRMNVVVSHTERVNILSIG